MASITCKSRARAREPGVFHCFVFHFPILLASNPLLLLQVKVREDNMWGLGRGKERKSRMTARAWHKSPLPFPLSSPFSHRRQKALSPPAMMRHRQTPWHTHLTLDLLIHVLSRTLFSPFLSALLPLCLRALATPYSSPSFILTSAFAIAVSLYYLLQVGNQRVAYGKPRKVKWENEVVVVTGGVGGLGVVLAEILGARGVGVAVLDVEIGDGDGEGWGKGRVRDGEEKEGVWYFRCDVGSYEDIQRTWKRVVQELGTPTVLINNAAVVNAKPFLEQDEEDVEKTFRVNTFSHYHLNRLFVQGLLSRASGGTIVTVSSVLAHLGAAQLSAYTASKAALLAYHSSLTTELAIIAPQIKTILVAPGQLDTQLFGNVKLQGWLRNFCGPVVGAGEVAMKIVEMVDRGEGGVVSEPVYARWIAWLGVLPAGVQKLLKNWSGMDSVFGGLLRPPILAAKHEASNSSDSDSDRSSKDEED